MNNVSAWGRTDPGLKRSRNEDSYAIDAEKRFFIIADGMGGHPGGDIASVTAIATANEFLAKALADNEITWPFGIDHSLPQEINVIASAMRLANRRIFNESKGMGTTMVVMLLKNNKAHICHVGDSRLYRVRNSAIEQLTEDHSLVTEEIKRGMITREQARHYALRHVITRAIGTAGDVECDCRVEEVRSGDIFLLCTDGLSGMLDDAAILEAIMKDEGEEQTCERLVRRANEKGGDDNITVIVVRCT